MISVHFQGKLSNFTVIQVYALTSNAEETIVDQFYEDLQDILELTPKQCPFHHRELECKSRKSRNTHNNKEVWLGVQNEAGKRLSVLSKEHTGHSKHSFPPFSSTRDGSTNGHNQMVNIQIRLIMLFAAEDGEVQHSQ